MRLLEHRHLLAQAGGARLLVGERRGRDRDDRHGGPPGSGRCGPAPPAAPDRGRGSGAAGRVQDTLRVIARSCSRRQLAGSARSAAARARAQLSASAVAGPNTMPVATPSSSAASLASITVSAKPADAGHDRDRAVAQAVELGQAAGLEARGHEDRVARRPAAGARAARHSRTRSRPGRGGPVPRREAGLERRLAGAQHRELAAMGEQGRQGRQEQVEPLLRGEAADHDAQERVGIGVEAEALLDRGAVAGGLEAPGVVAGRQVGVGRRVPDRRRRCRWRCRPGRAARLRRRPCSPMPSASVWISWA